MAYRTRRLGVDIGFQNNGLDAIEALQESESEEVYGKAQRILETYFQLEEDEEQLLPDPNAKTALFDFSGNGQTSISTPTGGFTFGQ